MQIDETTSGIPKPPFAAGACVQFEGSHDGLGLRIGIVSSRFNAAMTGALATAAREGLTTHGVREEDICVAWVPGAFELPLAIQTLAEGRPLDAIIALGVVIEGETPHAELITSTVTRALARLGQSLGIPVIDGVVAARNQRQAEARSLTGRKSRGWHAALAAIETARVLAALRKGSA